MIRASVTSQGRYADGKEFCELHITSHTSDKLPHEYRKKIPIQISIGGIAYDAGVHETRYGTVWISSVLYKMPSGDKTRLVDAIARICILKGDKVVIMAKEQGVFLLEKG